MDDNILQWTKTNIVQRQDRFFVQGDPGAVLAIELAAESREEAANLAEGLVGNAFTDETPMIGIEPSGIRLFSGPGMKHQILFRAASCRLRGN
jgi:hypothetical protein